MTTRRRSERSGLCKVFGQFRRSAHACRPTAAITFDEEQVAEFRLANTYGIFQHGLEYRCQLARRRTNDAQHLCRSGLPLARLFEFTRLALKLFLQIGNRRTGSASGL